LESHRHQTVIVGENLGTVPDSVQDEMKVHEIYGMNVGQFCARANVNAPLEPISRLNVASLNTHDTATFAGYWHGRDIEERCNLGLLRAEDQIQEQENRTLVRQSLTSFLQSQGYLSRKTEDPALVLAAWLSYIANGSAASLLINLEDLWLEEKPQNVPGTWTERPNWRRKASLSLEQFSHIPQILDVLKTIDKIRKARNAT